MERVAVRARGYVDEASMKEDYTKFEFHMLDLKQGKVIDNLMPPLVTTNSRGGVVSLGSSFYIFGGSALSIRPPLRRHRPAADPPKDQQLYLGASRFDFNSPNGGWKSAPLPIKSTDSSVFIPLLGQIYGFGFQQGSVEVFDPTLNQWKLLGYFPTPFDQCGINSLVLPDPKNRRIIVSFCNYELNTMPLCVYYPPSPNNDTDAGTALAGGGRWECIIDNFPLCNHVVAHVDDVLYVYHEDDSVLFRAYDLTTNQWLDITWTITLPDDAVKQFYRWDTLFVLHDNVLCLAGWSPPDSSDRPGIEIILLKLRVDRSGASTIHVTFLHAQGFHLPSPALIFDLLPLDQEAFC